MILITLSINKYLLKLYGMDKATVKKKPQKKTNEEAVKNVVSHRSKSVITEEVFKNTKSKVRWILIIWILTINNVN